MEHEKRSKMCAHVRPLNPKNTKPEKSEVKGKSGRGSGGLNSKSWGQRSPIFLVYSHAIKLINA